MSRFRFTCKIIATSFKGPAKEGGVYSKVSGEISLETLVKRDMTKDQQRPRPRGVFTVTFRRENMPRALVAVSEQREC